MNRYNEDESGVRSIEAQQAKQKELDKMMKAFLKTGGKIQHIPYGVVSDNAGSTTHQFYNAHKKSKRGFGKSKKAKIIIKKKKVKKVKKKKR